MPKADVPASARGKAVYNRLRKYGAHPAIDYSKYRYPSALHWEAFEGDGLKGRAKKSYQTIAERIDAAGGVEEHLWHTRSMLAGASRVVTKGAVASEDVREHVNIPEYATHATAAMRYKRFIQLPAVLETIAAWEEFDNIEGWVCEQIAQGLTHTEIAMSCGVRTSTLVDIMMTQFNLENLRLAHQRKVESTMQTAEALVNDALATDFEDPKAVLKAESQARVMSGLSGFLKAQAQAVLPAYAPKKIDVTATPGNISINFGAPE
jgi:hypothetical protein